MNKYTSTILILSFFIFVSKLHAEEQSFRYSRLGDCKVETFKGHYSAEFGYSAIILCGNKFPYQLSTPSIDATDELRKKYEDLGGLSGEFPPTKIYIEAKGCISEPGNYGSRGFKHEVKIAEVLVAKKREQYDCEPDKRLEDDQPEVVVDGEDFVAKEPSQNVDKSLEKTEPKIKRPLSLIELNSQYRQEENKKNNKKEEESNQQ